MPKLIDTHAHVNFNSFKDDADEVITRAHDADINMFLVGSQINTSKRAIAYAEKYKDIYAIIGLHPVHLVEFYVDEQEVNFKSRKEEFDYEAYRELALNPKTIGIGECGLDYSKIDDVPGDNEEIKKHQKSTFRKQIELSLEVGKPLAIHCRDAYEDVLLEIRKFISDTGKTPKALMHCYLGTKELAKEFIKLGFYISFSGIITFKNAGELGEVVKSVPMSRILVETDCPYLAPEPKRGQRNEPLYVKYTAKKVAELKGESSEKVFLETTNNAKKLFNII